MSVSRKEIYDLVDEIPEARLAEVKIALLEVQNEDADRLALKDAIRESQKDAAAGNTRPAREVLQEIRSQLI